MKNIKKITALLLALTFIFVLTSCGDDKPTTPSTTVPATSAAPTSSAAVSTTGAVSTSEAVTTTTAPETTSSAATTSETEPATTSGSVDIQGNRYLYNGVSILVPDGFTTQSGDDGREIIYHQGNYDSSVLLSTSDFDISDYSEESEKEIWEDIYNGITFFELKKDKIGDVDTVIVTCDYSDEGEKYHEIEVIIFKNDTTVHVDFCRKISEYEEEFDAMLQSIVIESNPEPTEVKGERYSYNGVSILIPDGFNITDGSTVLITPPDYPVHSDNVSMSYSADKISDYTEESLKTLLSAMFGDIKNFELEKGQIQGVDAASMSFDVSFNGVEMSMVQIAVFLKEKTVNITFTIVSGDYNDALIAMMDSIEIE